MIIPEDNSVSRLHGFFKVNEGDKIKIYDRMSKFGTLVYEKDKKVRVRESSLVGVEIGNTVFSFKLSEQGWSSDICDLKIFWYYLFKY